MYLSSSAVDGNSRVAVVEVLRQFRKAKDGERPPLEAVIR
jgi:hypothetical protein